MVLHNSKNREMRTGEGKALVATLYLNACQEKRCTRHYRQRLPRLNDAGALWSRCTISWKLERRRDRLQPFERQTAFGADITYGTNEFSCDYLRDNMVMTNTTKFSAD